MLGIDIEQRAAGHEALSHIAIPTCFLPRLRADHASRAAVGIDPILICVRTKVEEQIPQSKQQPTL